MTREEFDQMGEIDQLSLVLSDGILLSQNRIEEGKIFLYGMEEFYVMVTFEATSDELRSLLSCDDCTEFLFKIPTQEKFFDPASRPSAE